MDKCKKCSLPSNFPGADIDGTGLCHHCRTFIPPSPEEMFKIRTGLEKELSDAAAKLCKKKIKYHCAVALSGGKDSSYTTWLLAKKYKLNVLAITVDIGYLQDQAYKNISSLTEKLGVDHVFIKEQELFNAVYKYGFSGKFFSKNEGLACGICCKLIPNVILAYAIEHDIPWIALGNYGLKEPKLFLETERFILSPEKYDPAISKLFSESKKLCTNANSSQKGKKLPKILHPLNSIVDYSETKMVEELQDKVGVKKEHFFSEQTTCLISMVTMYMYQKARGYNPYSADVCNQIRHGLIDKDNAGIQDALANMGTEPETKKLVVKALKSIGVTK